MTKLTLDTDDLNDEALIEIRKSLAPYAHLAAYRKTWEIIVEAAATREHNRNRQVAAGRQGD